MCKTSTNKTITLREIREDCIQVSILLWKDIFMELKTQYSKDVNVITNMSNLIKILKHILEIQRAENDQNKRTQ